MRRPSQLLGAAALAVALICGGLPAIGAAKPLALPDPPLPIEVKAVPITQFRPGSDQIRFGALEFRGGLRLTPSFAGFGGISGLALASDGKAFLAVTDAGVLLSGSIEAEGDRPIGLSNVRAAALLDTQGRVQALRGRVDAEAIAVAPSGVYVSFEDAGEVWRYPSDPLGALGTLVPMPAQVKREVKALRRNKGLESLVVVPPDKGPLGGALLAVGEEGVRPQSDLPGFILGGATPGSFSIRRLGPFAATDLALGPRGDLYLLERDFAYTRGVSMRIRRFPLADVKPGAMLEGEILITADMGYDIDNMEGLAVTQNPRGETLLTLISDDNFSPIQRTILLRFAVVAP